MKREELIKQIKERYLTAHCNPDFKGDAFKFIFDDLSSDAKDNKPNLEQLEKRLDAALEKETPESLNKFLASDAADELPGVDEIQPFLYWVFHKADRIAVEHTLGWRKDAIKEMYQSHKLMETPEETKKRNWEEDYPDENGNYQNCCVYCKELFFGHKRRMVCKLCFNIIQHEEE